MRVVDPSERDLHDSTLDSQHLLADFLLSAEAPIVSRLMQKASSHQHPLSSIHLPPESQLPTPFAPCFVALRTPPLSARLRSPCMATDREDEDALTDEWNKLQAHRATRMGSVGDVVRGLSTVWVLVSNLGNSNEGVYTLRSDRDRMYVLAFYRQGDAEKYEHLVKNIDMTAVQWTPQQLRAFCQGRGFEVALTPQGQLVIPPTKNTNLPNPETTEGSEGHDRARTPWIDQRELGRYSQDVRSSAPHNMDPSTMEGRGIRRPNNALQRESKIWVVMVNPGQANQGVYTLQNRESQNTLAFVKKEDAKQFADQLQAAHSHSGFGVAAPIQWDADELRKFCEDGGYKISLISEGMSITPPEVNEYDLEAFSNAGGAVRRSSRLPLNRRLHLENLRALLEYRFRQSFSEDDDFQA